jgi:glycosyltransferase involved in cell wall biosynthesis
MSSSPVISVVMSVYNTEKYIAESIESVLNQTFSNFEFIIVEDCCTDNTLEIIKKYQHIDNRIIILSNKENIGLTKSLNKAIDFSKGKYIARMDADDICTENRFEIQYNYLEKNTDIGLCGSWCENFGDKSGISKFNQSHNSIKFGLLFQCQFCHSTIMFRSELYKKYYLKYNEEFITAQDFELWSRMITVTKAINLPIPLLKIRFHNESISAIKKEQQLNNRNKIIRNQFKKIDVQINDLEIEKYVEFCNSSFKFSFKEYEEFVKFIEICSIRNKMQNYIDSDYFNQQISELLFHLSYNMGVKKRNVYSIYKKSHLSKFYNCSLKNKLKFFIKLNF